LCSLSMICLACTLLYMYNIAHAVFGTTILHLSTFFENVCLCTFNKECCSCKCFSSASKQSANTTVFCYKSRARSRDPLRLELTSSLTPNSYRYIAASRGLLQVAIQALPEYCHKCTMFLCSSLYDSYISAYTCFTSIADCVTALRIVQVWRACKTYGITSRTKSRGTVQVQWHPTFVHSSFHRVESPR